MNILAPHTPRSQLPFQKPHRSVSSDQTTFAVSVHSSSRPFNCLPSPKKRGFFVVFTKDVCRPISHASPQVHSTAPPFPQEMLGSRNCALPRLQLGMAIDDQVYKCFAVTTDFRRRRSCTYSEADRDTMEAREVFWSMSGEFVITKCCENKYMYLAESSFPLPLR